MLYFKKVQYFAIQKKDYYKIIGVPSSATIKEIKQKYHAQAKVYHPDNHDTANEEKFKELSEAYSVLGDKEKKEKYDIDRIISQRNQQQHSGGRRGAHAEGFMHEQYNRYRQKQQSQSQNQQEYTNAYKEAQRMEREKDPNRFKYKTTKDYEHFNKHDFDDGVLVEEGFLNTLKNAPELILLTALIGIITIRWMMMVYEEKQRHLQRNEQFERSQKDPSYKPKKKLSINECKQRSLSELDELTQSGQFILPPKYESMLAEYRELKREVDAPMNYSHDSQDVDYELDEQRAEQFQKDTLKQQKSVYERLADHETDAMEQELEAQQMQQISAIERQEYQMQQEQLRQRYMQQEEQEQQQKQSRQFKYYQRQNGQAEGSDYQYQQGDYYNRNPPAPEQFSQQEGQQQQQTQNKQQQQTSFNYRNKFQQQQQNSNQTQEQEQQQQQQQQQQDQQ